MANPEGASAPSPANSIPYRQNAAEHIRELSQVNAQIPTLLLTAGTAVSQLTLHPVVPPISTALPSNTRDTTETRKQIIQQTSFDLINAIDSISSTLLTQIADLASSNVIPAQQLRFSAPNPPPQIPGRPPLEANKDPESSVINGGLGDMDVGALNARAGVRNAGGEEVLDRVQEILKTLVEQAQAKEENGERSSGGGQMVVDG